MQLIHISEAFRMFKRAMRVKRNGFKQYEGSAEEICKQVIDDCYNKKESFFQTSTGHFCEFYSRDFGMCVDSLMKLGYKEEVHKTLQYAIKKFKHADKITTTISPKGKPFDFPYIAVDSVPFLIYSLRVANAHGIIKQNKQFLADQVNKFVNAVVDKKTGMVNPKKDFSTMKDHAKRSSSCYGNCMLHLLSTNLNKLNLPNPLKEYNYTEIITNEFWNGEYFFDDTRKESYIAGDANTYPFWVGAIEDEKIFQKAHSAIKTNKLDIPLPLKYTQKVQHKFHMANFFAPDYEVDSCWVHLGMAYLQVLQKFKHNDLRKHLNVYKDQITKYKTFLELYDKEGNPYKSIFYITDEGMLWAANWLCLSNKLDKF